MRHKMRFVCMFILTLIAAGVTQTEGTLESWGYSQLLDIFGHDDHQLEPDANAHRSLSRHRRAAPTVSEYVLDVEISIPDPAMAALIKQYLNNDLTFPLALGVGDTNVTSIKVTTACNQTGSEVQCSCESGYQWSSDVCTTYAQCPGVSNCSCIKSPTFPTQYCQPQTVSINLSLRILNAFTADLQNPSSVVYQTYKKDLEDQFNRSYSSLSGFRSATVKGFRPGSVIADYTVVTEPTTAAALTAANNNLISNLASTPYNAASISSVVTGWSNISVSQSSVYVNDTVNLICTANVTTYSFVSWYFNGTLISNTSDCSFKTVNVAGGIQSYLTIQKSSLSNSGTYQCNIESNSITYTSETTLQVQTMDLTVLTSTAVTCDNQNVPIIKCCTNAGTVTFNLTCQKISGNIIGIANTLNPLCQAYTIMTTPQQCSSPSYFNCNCATIYGAALSQGVSVTYKATAVKVNITASSERISEWTDLNLNCTCDTPNAQMSWNFISNAGVSAIAMNFYTFNPTTCTSVLTIPSTSTSVNWNGTFNCQVNSNYSANKTILVYRKAKPSDITLIPSSTSFKCNDAIAFSCSVDGTEYYQTDKTILEVNSSSGVGPPGYNMTLSNGAFTFLYPVDSTCATLTARCIITNLINDTVQSETMTYGRIQNPQCINPPPGTNIGIGVGEAGKTNEISCQQLNSTLDGKITYSCNGVTKQWDRISDTCVAKVLTGLNKEAEILSTSPNSNALVPSVISRLNEAVNTDQTITNSTGNIELVVNILQQSGDAVKQVQTSVMQDFLNTVSIVVDNSKTTTWNSVPNKTVQSSNLLKSVELFAEKLVFQNATVTINEPNVKLQGNLAGNLTSNFNANFEFDKVNNLTGNVLIAKSILDQLPKDTRVVSIAYATLKDIIGVPQNSTSNSTVNGLVMTTVLSNSYSDFSIGMDFKKSNKSLANPKCVWWNFTIKDWDSTGCHLQNNNSESVYCVCDHLTSFSILMSTSEISPEDELILSLITYIGVGISMLSLVICIIIEATVWKSVTKNKTSYLRHVCIMNIAVTLLMADIWFIIGAAMNTTDKVQVCVASTFFAHVFYLCVFFWMLTMGLILFYRLMCVFHDLSKTIMMGIAFFLGYGCPIIISVITVAVTQPSNNYIMPKTCWLNIQESKAFLAFVLPAFTILMVNFITLLVVIVKVLRPSVGDKPKKEEKSSLNHIAKCIMILTPLLGLTWGFGIGTMASKSTVIHGIFAALNSLQGLFILLFGCLMDKKVRDALFSRFSISKWSSQQTKSSNLSSTEPTFSKGVINLFAKKVGSRHQPKTRTQGVGIGSSGVYNISSAQVNSSSDMASSNSYSLLS